MQLCGTVPRSFPSQSICKSRVSEPHGYRPASHGEPAANGPQAPWAGLICVNENMPPPFTVTSTSWVDFDTKIPPAVFLFLYFKTPFSIFLYAILFEKSFEF